MASRIDAQVVKVQAQHEFKQLESPDQGGEGRGNENAIAQWIIVGHYILFWDGTGVLKGGGQVFEMMTKLTTHRRLV